MREQLEQLLKDNDLSDKLNDDWLKSQHKPILNMYVDMSTMFDYKLTALLGLCKVEKEHEYIQKQMDTYLKYKGKNITTCFPALKFKEEDILNFMTDPKNRQFLCCGGIITNISNLIPAQIFMAEWINKQSPFYKDEPVNIHFVNEYFEPYEPYMKMLIHELTKSFPNIRCDFKKVKIVEEHENYLSNMDILILDDMETFIDEKYKTHELFFTKKFSGSFIHATCRFDENAPFIDQDGKERIENTEELFNTFCTFSFFNKMIISHMPKEGDIYGTAFDTSDR